MSTLDKVLEAIREAVVVNERIAQLTRTVEKLSTDQENLRDRVIRIEALIEYARGSRDLPAPNSL